MDFTLNKYKQLLRALHNGGYEFVTMEELVKLVGKGSTASESHKPVVCLRHDVDKRAKNSLRMAKLEAKWGIRATYYFRVTKDSNNEEVIRHITAMGHEIGYHYEDMAICHGDTAKAYAHFQQWLGHFRQFYPVSTICMHGAPTSAYDGRDLWKTYDYKQMGIVCEPYLDLDYSKVLYLTDTGRRWDGYRVSLRDKIPHYQDQWTRDGLTFHETDELIDFVEIPHGAGDKQYNLLLTTHPQRWSKYKHEWMRELLSQKAKNIVKSVLVFFKGK